MGAAAPGYAGGVPEPATHPRRLLVDGRDTAELEVPGTWRSRARGLLGREHVAGAVLLRPARSVHTFGMRFPIDVALCTASLEVVGTCMLVPGRATLPRPGVRALLEAEAGAFDRWALRPGSQLAITGWRAPARR